MSRITEALTGGRKLVCFVTAGFPTPELSIEHALACVEGGADVLELGVPFSDPVADGRVIQHTSQKALDEGMTPLKVFDLAREIRERTEAPIVLMASLGYIISALVGVVAVILVTYLLSRMLGRKNDDETSG